MPDSTMRSAVRICEAFRPRLIIRLPSSTSPLESLLGNSISCSSPVRLWRLTAKLTHYRPYRIGASRIWILGARTVSLDAATCRANCEARLSMSVRAGGRCFAKYRTSPARTTSPCRSRASAILIQFATMAFRVSRSFGSGRIAEAAVLRQLGRYHRYLCTDRARLPSALSPESTVARLTFVPAADDA